MKRRHFLYKGLAAITVVLPILQSCYSSFQVPLRVGSIVWPGYEPLFLARDLGYYQNHPIELRDYPSSTEVSQALRNGDLEVAAVTMDEALLLAETNPDIRVILINDFSNGADVLLAKPELKTLADLKGRRIGVESSALGGYVLTRVLTQANLSLQEIQVVSLVSSEHEQAYKQNLVDAVITFEPTRSNLLKVGANILFDSSQIPGEIVDVLVTRQETLTKRKNDLKALVDGWFEAVAYNQQNPQDAARRMAIREQISPEQFVESLKLLTIPDRSTNFKLLSKADPSLLQNVQRLVSVMLANNLLKQEIAIESLFSAELVQVK